MFKKLVLLLAFLLIAGVSWASVDNKTIIDAVQLDDDPTSITGTYGIQNYNKVGFFVKYDETQVGSEVSAAVTMHFSYDNSNWVTGYFYDLGGGTTLQTSETLSSDGWYYCWLDPNWQIPYVRVTITATNTDTDDLATVTTYLVGSK
jgi:hypothetical protein